MALGSAKAHILGNVVKDIEIRTTPSGKKVGSFTLAVNKTKEKVSYLDCIAWEKTLDLIETYITKGTQLYVICDVVQSSWKTKDGQNRSKIEFNVDDFRLVYSKTEDRPLKQHEVIAAAHEDVVPDDDAPIDLSEIPF